MAIPVVRISWFQADQRPRAEAEQESLKVYSHADGCVRAYWGQEVEDPTTYYFISEWKTREKEELFFNSPALQPFFTSIQALAKEYKTYDVSFDHADMQKVFSAPVTAISWIRLKNEEDRAKLVEINKLVAKAVEIIPGAIACASGTTTEDENMYVLAIGRESLEAANTGDVGQRAQAALQETRKIADVTVKNVKLQVYEKQ